MSSTHLPALHMSHIIAPDAPLTSPISDAVSVPWDRDPALAALYDPFSLPLSASPPGSAGLMPGALPMSVPETRKVLRSTRMSPDEVAEQQCLPTHQVFDFAPGANPGTPDMVASSPASSPESSPQTQAQPLPQRGAATHHTSSFSASSASSSSTRGSTPSAGSVVVPAKRPSVGPTSAATKKARGERITVKDFVPPDVTGLSKREARLVKNRAAAFLSRQRKREEFENMEIRVAELEQENARLLALAQQSQQQSQSQVAPQPDPSLLSEVEQLRRQLAETQKRERELAAKLRAEEEEAAAAAQVEQGRKADGVKVEAVEPQLQASLRAHKGERSGASFGLMVLLCALPTLLSMPAHHAMSNSGVSFSAPSHSHSHSHSTSLDMATFPTSDYDWNLGGLGSGAMDLDLAPSPYEHERPAAAATEPEFKKLEFVDVDAEKLGLSGLDISFDASAARDGRIRVRIHPPGTSASSSSASSENGSDNGTAQLKETQPEEDQTMWHDAEDDLGPFLGIGANDFSFDSAGSLHAPPSALDLAYPSTSLSSYASLSSYSAPSSLSSPSHVSSPTSAFFPGAPSPSALGNGEYEFELGSEYGSSSGMSRAGSPGALGGAAGRRRVRIALRGMPGKGREGGEWEVEVC